MWLENQKQHVRLCVSDGTTRTHCQTSHASSVMANYNWQLMLESGQAQTDASWQNNSDDQHVHWKQNITLQSAQPLRSGPVAASCLTSHDLNGTAAPAIKESHNSSERPDTLMLLCPSWPFGMDSFCPPGFQPERGHSYPGWSCMFLTVSCWCSWHHAGCGWDVWPGSHSCI